MSWRARRTVWSVAMAGIAAALSSPDASAQGFNIDFGNGTYGIPTASFGAAANQPGAWNETSLGVTALVDLEGQVTSVSINVSATSDAGSAVVAPLNDTEDLLFDYLYSNPSIGWFVTVQGLRCGDYRIFFYAPASGNVDTGDIEIQFQGDVASIPGTSTLVEGVSWVSADVRVGTAGSGTFLNISGLSTALHGLAGLQIVPLARESLNLDLGTGYGPPSDAFAAAAGQVGTWGSAGTGVTQPVDLSGFRSSCVSVNVTGIFPSIEAPGPTNDTETLLKDWITGFAPTPWEVELIGLAPGDYELYLYAPSAASYPTSAMTVEGVPVSSLPGASTLIEGTSWVRVDVALTDYTLTISGDGTVNSGLAGLQLIARTREGLNVDLQTPLADASAPLPSYLGAANQGGVWTQAGIFGSAVAMDGLDGGPSGASVVVTAGLANTAVPGTGDENLLNDWIWFPGMPWGLEIFGLRPGLYRVYLYAPSDPSFETGDMVVEGVAVPSMPGSLQSELIEGISWKAVDVVLLDDGLTITSSPPGGINTGLSGFQVVPRVAASVNIDLGRERGTPPPTFGAAAALPGVWNDVYRTRRKLFDLAGQPSGVSISLDVNDDSLGLVDTQDTDAEFLLEDTIAEYAGEVWWVDISGLAAGDYSVYLYAYSDAAVSTGTMSVAGTIVPEIPGDPGSALIEDVSWTRVDVTVPGSSLTIAGAGSTFTGLAGVQLLPEPGGPVSLASGALLLSILHRIRRGRRGPKTPEARPSDRVS